MVKGWYMREIKFRTWNPKFNYFEYWGFYNDDIDNKPYFKGTPSGGGFISNQILYNTEQYTNLKDKKGKDIYECDIGRHENGRIIIVQYNESMKLITARYLDDPESEKPIYIFAWQYIEIISNIHENPDLLK